MEWPTRPAAALGAVSDRAQQEPKGPSAVAVDDDANGTAPLADVLLAALSDQTAALSDAAAHFGRDSDNSATHPVTAFVQVESTSRTSFSISSTGGLPIGGATTPLRAAAAALDVPRSPGQIDFHTTGASHLSETSVLASSSHSSPYADLPPRKATRRLSWWAPSRDPERMEGKEEFQSNPGLLARIGHVGTGLRRVAQIAVDKLGTGPSRSSGPEQQCNSSEDAALEAGRMESHESAAMQKAEAMQRCRADGDARSSDSDQLHGAAASPKKCSGTLSCEGLEEDTSRGHLPTAAPKRPCHTEIESAQGSTTCKQPGGIIGIQSSRAVAKQRRPQPMDLQVNDDDLESTRVLGPWAAGWLCSQEMPQQHRRKELLLQVKADHTAPRSAPSQQNRAANAQDVQQMRSNASSEESTRKHQPESNRQATQDNLQAQQPISVSHWTIVSSDSEELERRERALQERERQLQTYERQLKERERELIAREEDAEDSQSLLEDATIEITRAVEADEKTATPSCGTQTTQDVEDSQNLFEEVASELGRMARLRGYGQVGKSPFTQVPLMAQMPATSSVHCGASDMPVPQWRQRGVMPQPEFSQPPTTSSMHCNTADTSAPQWRQCGVMPQPEFFQPPPTGSMHRTTADTSAPQWRQRGVMPQPEFPQPPPTVSMHCGATDTSVPQWRQHGPQPQLSQPLRSASEPVCMPMPAATVAAAPRKPGTLRSSYIHIASGAEHGGINSFAGYRGTDIASGHVLEQQMLVPQTAPSMRDGVPSLLYSPVWPVTPQPMEVQNILFQQLPTRTAEVARLFPAQTSVASQSTPRLQSATPVSGTPALLAAEWLNHSHAEHAEPCAAVVQSTGEPCATSERHAQQRPLRSRRGKFEAAPPPPAHVDVEFSFASDAPSSQAQRCHAESSSDACSSTSGQFTEKSNQQRRFVHGEFVPEPPLATQTNRFFSGYPHASAPSRDHHSRRDPGLATSDTLDARYSGGTSSSENAPEPPWSHTHPRIGKGGSYQHDAERPWPTRNKCLETEHLHASAEGLDSHPRMTHGLAMANTPGGRNSGSNSSHFAPETPWSSTQANYSPNGNPTASAAGSDHHPRMSHNLPTAHTQDEINPAEAKSFEQHGNDVSFGISGMQQTSDNSGPTWTSPAQSNSCSPCPPLEIHWSDPQCNEAFQSGRRARQDLWLRPGHLRSDTISGENRRSAQKPLVEPHLEPLHLEQQVAQHDRKRSNRSRQARTGSALSRRRKSARRGVSTGQSSQHPPVPSTVNDQCGCDLPGQSVQQRPRSSKKRNKIKANSVGAGTNPEPQTCDNASIRAGSVAEQGNTQQVPSLQVPPLSSPRQLSNGSPISRIPPQPGEEHRRAQSSDHARARRKVHGSAQAKSSGGQRQRRRRELRPAGSAAHAQLPAPEAPQPSKSASPEEVRLDANPNEVEGINQDRPVRKSRSSHHSLDSFDVSSSAGSALPKKGRRRGSVAKHRSAHVFQLGDTEDGAEDLSEHQAMEESSDWEKIGDSPQYQSQRVSRPAREAQALRTQGHIPQPADEASPIDKRSKGLFGRAVHSEERLLHVDSHRPTPVHEGSAGMQSQRKGAKGRGEGRHDQLQHPSRASTPASPSGASNSNSMGRAVPVHLDIHSSRHAGMEVSRASKASAMQARKALRERALKSLYTEESSPEKVAKDFDNDINGLSLTIPESPQNISKVRRADLSEKYVLGSAGRSHDTSPQSDVGTARVGRKGNTSSGERVPVSPGSDAGEVSPACKKDVVRVPDIAALKQLATTRSQERARQINPRARQNSGSSIEGICFKETLPPGESSGLGAAYWSSQEHADSFSPSSPASPVEPITPTGNAQRLSAAKASPNKAGEAATSAPSKDIEDEAAFASRRKDQRFAIKNEADLNFASRKVATRSSASEEAAPKNSSSDVVSPKNSTPDAVSAKNSSDAPLAPQKSQTQSAPADQSQAIPPQSNEMCNVTNKEDSSKKVEEAANSAKVQASPASNAASDVPTNAQLKTDVDPELQPLFTEAKRIFQELDVNNDRSISKIELLRGLKASGEVRSFFGLPAQIRQEDAESRKALEQVFQSIDRDENKSISWTELEKWINESKHLRGQHRRLQTPSQVPAPQQLPVSSRSPSKASSGKQDQHSSQESEEGSSSEGSSGS